MRLLLAVVIILLAVTLGFFLKDNMQTFVPVTVGQTFHPELHIIWVLLSGVALGVICTAIIAIAEGARTRLENRRLRRDLHKQETEINYLRTQPPTAPRPEPDALEPAGALPVADEPRTRVEPPSAPVYGTGGDDDDDVYTGGRAV